MKATLGILRTETNHLDDNTSIPEVIAILDNDTKIQLLDAIETEYILSDIKTNKENYILENNITDSELKNAINKYKISNLDVCNMSYMDIMDAIIELI